MKRKMCGKCSRRRNVTAFVTDRKRPDALYPYCRDCQKQYASEWRRKNHERELAKSRLRAQQPRHKKQQRNSHLKRTYGITLVEFNVMRRRQRGLCLLCLNYFGTKLVVDHDHKTGRVRGLLCTGCNSDIRLFENDPRMVRRVLQYLAP